MDVEFDPAKDAENRRKHGISLSRATEFDLGLALIKVDDRKNYGEIRFRSTGWLDGSLFVLVFTLRQGRVRAISLRSANRKERKHHADNA